MAGSLLGALVELERHGNRPNTLDFTFQHRLCHDFESLIWVVVYAMMIHHRNGLAATNPEMCGIYKKDLDACWAVHAYSNLLRSQNHMIAVGCAPSFRHMAESWFPDPREAAFFRDAMRLLRNQTHDEEPITYEGLCTLFKKHIQLATEPQAPVVVSK